MRNSKLSLRSFVNIKIFELLFFIILMLMMSCSTTVSGSGGGIEAGNSAIAVAIIGGDSSTIVSIVPKDYNPIDNEISTVTIDTVKVLMKKNIFIESGEYSLVARNNSSTKMVFVKDIIVPESTITAVACSLSTTGILCISNNNGSWNKGTYFFIPNTPLIYKVDSLTNVINWQLPESLYDSVFVVLSGDKDSLKLIGTSIAIDSDSIKNLATLEYKTIVGGASSRFQNIAINSGGAIWIGCSPDSGEGKNLFSYSVNYNFWKGYDKSASVYFLDGITALTANDSLFIGTPDGFLQFDNQTFSYHKPYTLKQNIVVDIITDNFDATWYLYSFAVSSSNFTKEYKIKNGRTITIAQDSSIWVGTISDGICQLTHSLSLIKKYTTQNSTLASDSIYGSCTDSLGSIWFSTAKGLVSFSNDNWDNNPLFVKGNRVKKIACSPSTKVVWFITENNKLYSIREKNITLERNFSLEFAKNQKLMDIALKDSNAIWLVVKNRGLIKITLR